uniref:Dipeptidylpeptidase IV N-terminal domain-containing protein n=1 Tax=Timema monikensis TaxID=170555 RepID=A0A7R9EFH2_9NEOP|nr:unnamed protein product [Timema monikensis]
MNILINISTAIVVLSSTAEDGEIEVRISVGNKYHLAPFEVDSDQPSLQYVAWSPGGNALAFVYKNDVYYKPRAKSSEIYKVTNTGELGVIYNGVPDWLYEGSELAFAWRESGKPFREKPPPVHPTEIRTSISPSSAVELNTTSALDQLRHRGGLGLC